MTIIACSRCPYPLRKYGAHKHESWELILQVTGSNRTKVGQEVYEMREGDVVAVPPGVSHEGISDGEFTDLFIKVDRLPFQGALHVSDQEGDIRTLMCMVHKITVQKEHNYRLIAEKLLVQESYMSIGNVALNCGYRDSFYFSRQFKKKFGETPRDYRQNRQ